MEELMPSPTPNTELSPLGIPSQKILDNNGYHIFQTFNNCGPAALSMALSFLGINASQQELGQALRPYQIPGGDNDDKSTTMDELGEKAREYGLTPFHRPNGNPELIKQFIANDIPVMTRTWTKPGEDISHYRVIKGYDEETNRLIQDDSLQNKNLWYTWEDFNELWESFNYEYLVLVPGNKLGIANQILGEDADYTTAWTKAAELSRAQLQKDPNNVNARFNLSVALHNIGDYQGSVTEFEKVESQLPFRTLWYQLEPVDSYYQLGNFDRVFQITDQILNNHNKAYSEAYILRGNIYKQQGNIDAARAEYEKAILYNKNLKAAQVALSSL